MVDLDRLSFGALVALAKSIPHETGTIELKSGLVQWREIAKPAAAFANSRGGLVIIGMTDHKHGADPIGVQANSITVDAVTAAISALTNPPVEVQVRLVRKRRFKAVLRTRSVGHDDGGNILSIMGSSWQHQNQQSIAHRAASGRSLKNGASLN